MPKKKMGRPKKPKAESLNAIVNVRATKEEKRTMARAAKRAHAAISAWARSALLRASRKAKK